MCQSLATPSSCTCICNERDDESVLGVAVPVVGLLPVQWPQPQAYLVTPLLGGCPAW